MIRNTIKFSVIFWSCVSLSNVELSGQSNLGDENQFRTNAPMISDSFVKQADFQQESLQKIERQNLSDHFSSASPLDQSSSGPNSSTHQSPLPDWLSSIESNASKVDFAKVFSSLAIVLAGYFAFVYLTRQFGGPGHQGLPEEVVEILGQTPFGNKKTLQLVRLGSKLILMLHTAEGMQNIGEITDPHEVDYLVSICGGKKSKQSAIAIRKASVSPPEKTSQTDLNQVLRQLQRSERSSGAVFDA